jgi:hypothetical protein
VLRRVGVLHKVAEVRSVVAASQLLIHVVSRSAAMTFSDEVIRA